MQQGAAVSCPGPSQASSVVFSVNLKMFSIKADCLNGQEMDSKPIFFYFSRCHRLPSDGETIQLFESTPTFMITFRAQGPVFCTMFSLGEGDTHIAVFLYPTLGANSAGLCL